MQDLETRAYAFEESQDVLEIYTTPDDFESVKNVLSDQGFSFLEAQVEMVPQNYMKLTDEEDIKNMTKMLEMLENNDDVQNVWHNWDNEE